MYIDNGWYGKMLQSVERARWVSCVIFFKLVFFIEKKTFSPGAKKMELSLYEQQRLSNIERNNGVLASLGLLGGMCNLDTAAQNPKPKPPTRVRVDTLHSEPSRRSDRVSKKPALFASGLGDAYFKSEDTDMDYGDIHHKKRPRRDAKRAQRYEEEFDHSVATRGPKRATKPLSAVTGPSALTTVSSNSSVVLPLFGMERKELPVGISLDRGGTSRSDAAVCPLCKRTVHCRTPKDGVVYLNKHVPCGKDVRAP